MTTELGYAEDETCNRDGCTGVIAIRDVEDCYCHQVAPCGNCTSPRGYCPVCEWDERWDEE